MHAGFINVDPDSEIVVEIKAYNKIGYSDMTSFSVYNGRRPDAPVDLEEDEIEFSHNETIQFSWNHGDDGGSDIV